MSGCVLESLVAMQQDSTHISFFYGCLYRVHDKPYVIPFTYPVGDDFVVEKVVNDGEIESTSIEDQIGNIRGM